MIVDDEKDILELLDYHLTKEGYITMKAFNGKDALKIAKDFLPDLVLLDLMMPEMDGIETCIEFREDNLLKGTLIAILTARAEDYSQIAGLNAGADDYINKPIKPRVLISRIKALLRRAESKVNVNQMLNWKLISKSMLAFSKEKRCYFLKKNLSY